MSSVVSPEFYWVAVVATTIISASRITRLATVDKFPPIRAVREWYEDRTDGTGWEWLTMCGYCFSFWATLLVVGTGVFCAVYDDPTEPVGDDFWPFVIWWLINGTLAMSYLAAWFMANDGTEGEDD